MSSDRRPTALALDLLDDRLVPAVIDLTAPGAEAPAGDALVRQTAAQPTGTGHIHSFVRVQGASSGGGSEQGYNTAARPLQFDENKSPQFTRALTVGAVPRREVGGVAYREFLLDINQKSSAPKLSLDEVKLFLASNPDATGYKASDPALGGKPSLGGQPMVFDLDAQGDVTVLLDARLNSGSGSGDMFLLVPESAFVGATADTFVYLYSKFGGLAGATANSGFEEWAVKGDGGGAPVVPPPPEELKSSLSGFAYYDQDRSGDLSDRDMRLEGVVMELRGTDYLGRTVVATTTTAADGSYTFADLLRGTYSIIEHDSPMYEGYWDVNQAGSLGGTVGDPEGPDFDKILDIYLAAGVHGLGYNFGEQSPLE